MRRVSLDFLQPGMELAKNIYSSDGRVLLSSGMQLNERFIVRLKDLGIHSVYIKDELIGSIDIPEMVSEKKRMLAVKAIKESYQDLERNKKLNTREIKGTVNTLIDEIMNNRDVLIGVTEISSFDDRTFAHSVNVCILTIVIGIALSYNEIQLQDLGVGALLHDIGKTRIDKAILNKKDKLSEEEFAEIQKHAEYGFDLLRNYPDISLLSSHIAFQHHERWDGQGYPRRLGLAQIHEYARIVAVSDVYDALMSDRPYHQPFTFEEANHILQKMSGANLEPRVVDCLIANVAVYPPGSIVELNTGSIAVVIQVNKENPPRPLVRVLYDLKANRPAANHEIDLCTLTTVRIVRILTEAEIQDLFEKITAHRMEVSSLKEQKHPYR